MSKTRNEVRKIPSLMLQKMGVGYYIIWNRGKPKPLYKNALYTALYYHLYLKPFNVISELKDKISPHLKRTALYYYFYLYPISMWRNLKNGIIRQVKRLKNAYYRQRILFIERKHDRIVRRAKYKFYKASRFRSKFFTMKEMLERRGKR